MFLWELLHVYSVFDVSANFNIRLLNTFSLVFFTQMVVDNHFNLLKLTSNQIITIHKVGKFTARDIVCDQLSIQRHVHFRFTENTNSMLYLPEFTLQVLLLFPHCWGLDNERELAHLVHRLLVALLQNLQSV